MVIYTFWLQWILFFYEHSCLRFCWTSTFNCFTHKLKSRLDLERSWLFHHDTNDVIHKVNAQELYLQLFYKMFFYHIHHLWSVYLTYPYPQLLVITGLYTITIVLGFFLDCHIIELIQFVAFSISLSSFSINPLTCLHFSLTESSFTFNVEQQ